VCLLLCSDMRSPISTACHRALRAAESAECGVPLPLMGAPKNNMPFS